MTIEARPSRLWSNETTKRRIGRKLISAGKARTALLQRTYPTTVRSLWSAITEPGHLRVWFIEPMGDLRLGGTFSFEGTAHGRIMRCDAPRSLCVTWLYGPGRADEVEVRLSPLGDDRTLVELEHATVADLAPDGVTDAIVGVGAGWELAMGLPGTTPEARVARSACWPRWPVVRADRRGRTVLAGQRARMDQAPGQVRLTTQRAMPADKGDATRHPRPLRGGP